MLKLSANLYTEEAKAAALAQLDPSMLDPEAVQHTAEVHLAAHLGVPTDWVMLTNSGTAALEIACRFLSRGRPLEFPVMTWPSTYSHTNGQRSYVDADPWPIWTQKKASEVCRIAVNLWGRKYLGDPVEIIDSAHFFGEGIQELNRGEIRAVCYSFGPRKEVPCVRGGAIVSKEIDPTWRAYRDSGTLGRYGLVPCGHNLEIAEPFAAMLIEQLKHAAKWREQRQELLQNYMEQLSGSKLRLLTAPHSSGHLCVGYVMDELARDALAYALQRAEIQTGLHYRLPVWMKPTEFPRAWELSKRVISLPLHLFMGEADVMKVCDVVKATL